jgi:hypothetical protein
MERELSEAEARFHHARRGLKARRPPPSLKPEALRLSVARWTSDDFRNRAYYGSLYLLAVQAGSAVLRYGEIQSQLGASKGNATTLEIRLGEALSVAKTEILNLKSKTDLAERTATTGELPQREGL